MAQLTVGSFLASPSQGAGNRPYAPVGAPPPSSQLDRLRTTDRQILQLFADIDSGAARYADYIGGPTGGAGASGLNPQIFVRQAERMVKLAKENPGRFAVGVATQVALQLLNRHGKIWNPVTLLPPPILQSFMATNLDVFTGTPRLLTGYDDSTPVGVDTKPGFYEVNHGPQGAGLPPQGTDLHVDLSRGRYVETQMFAGPPFVKTEHAGAGGPNSVIDKISPRLVGARSQDTSLVESVTSLSPIEPLVDAALRTRNTNDPETPGQRVLISDLVDKSITAAKDGTLGKGFKMGRDGQPKFDISLLYDNTRVRLGGYEWMPNRKTPLTLGNVNLERNVFVGGVIPVGFDGENQQGFFTTDENRNQPPVDDDVAYVPLSFSDLRPVGTKIRTVYFRPFITGLTEGFAPTWTKENYFGRVDPVASYQSTNRTVNLSFDVHCFKPEDVALAYKKLTWLQSMVYPEYDKDLVYRSGPVLRMRIGNVIDSLGRSGLRGLPGILDSLDFDYTEALWELKKDLKVPRSIKVSLTFTVLHDLPIGRTADGFFGGISLPAASSAPQAGQQSDKTNVNFAQSFRSVGDGNDYDPTKLR